MADAYSLDTNILVYAFDPGEPAKRSRARQLIQPDSPWSVSWQVVQEFIHVALHRFRKPLQPAYLDEVVRLLLAPHCRTFPSAALWSRALRIHTETGDRFYDAQIVAAAIESGSPLLYSEDLQHDRRIGPLHIMNPFR